MALAWAGVAIGLDGFTSWFDPHHGELMSLTDVNHEGRLHLMENTLLHHFGKTAEILIFCIVNFWLTGFPTHF